MFPVVVNADGLYRKFDTLANKAEDLTPALKVLGRHLLAKAKAKYKAQAFPGLAESTLQKRMQKGLRQLDRKLRSDVRKAVRRASKNEPRGFWSKVLGAPQSIDASAFQARGVKNRQAVLAEFQRRHGRMKQNDLVEKAGLKQLSLKQLVSLGGREDRTVGKAVSKPILGGLINTLEVKVEDGSVMLVSRTRGTWSSVHNDGGTAGHGAQEPERKTVELDEEDLDFFAEVLKEQHLLPALEA